MEISYDEIRALSGTIGLIFFVVIFLGVAWWTFNPKNKDKMNEHGNIPLNEDDDR